MALYDSALTVCEKYLSGDAKRFLDRQITSHLNLSPGTLMPSDKAELAKWCQASGKLILGPDKAEKLSSEVLAIS